MTDRTDTLPPPDLYASDEVGWREPTVRRLLAERDERIRVLEAALRELLECPYDIDEATIPKGGIEVAPEQVVGTMSVALVRRRNARKALENRNV